MNHSNRTIEEKLAIVQQLRSNANTTTNNRGYDKSYKTNNNFKPLQPVQNPQDTEESSPFLAFLFVRIVICVVLFCIIAFMGTRNPELHRYINTMITTEENGNLIDFMSPFTYTLQENVESAPEVQGDMNSDTSAPSEE